MKNIFRKAGPGRRGWYFEEADLTENVEEFSNPARGWYQIHTFWADKEPDFKELEWCIDKKDTLALILIDIGAFQDRDLDEEALNRIERILNFFAERKYDCIVRAVYDREGKAMEKEPFFFSQVMGHLRQVCGVLERQEAVFVYQGMLVGSWGEMHTSRFLYEEKLVQMGEVLRHHFGGRIYPAVRRPAQWRMLHQSLPGEAMGIFDDGMFGSEGNLGTFGSGAKENSAWDVPWAREDELNFEHELARYAPNGGEAVYGEGYVEGLTPEEVIHDLRQMGVSYLNRIYDAEILNLWKRLPYPGQGVWAGRSVYDYVGAHLGYRFLVRKASISIKKGSDMCILEVEVENIGFGGFYQEAELWLEMAEGGGKNISPGPVWQMKGWRGGEKRRLAWEIVPADCDFFLAAKRKRDGMAIRFANSLDEEGRAVLGHLYMEGEERANEGNEKKQGGHEEIDVWLWGMGKNGAD